MRNNQPFKAGSGTENDLLVDLVAYARVIAASAVTERAQGLIDSYEKAQAYVHLDGEKTDTDISRQIKVPRRTVTDWVSKFVSHGLAVRRGRSERALFTLEELGINVGALKRKRKKKPKEKAEVVQEDLEKEEVGE